MEGYNFKEVEPKWQAYWEQEGVYKTHDQSNKPKYYALAMFPYPSGSIHVGHVRNYTIVDVIARYRRMVGYEVLHPIGFDAFGMPAENAAIQHKVAPDKWTNQNVEEMEAEMRAMGWSYDWSREVATYRPDYYKWTQWLFLQFYKHGLAYKKEAPVNWCPKCQTVLANEQVVDGGCWRCDTPVVKKDLSQWFFKITQYADELLEGLDELTDWPERVRVMQDHWIGRSEGVQITFTSGEHKIDVYTTRPDTLYGVTYVVLAPEHPLVNTLSQGTPQEAQVKAFQEKMKGQSELARTAEDAPKEGLFIGAYATHPLTGQEVPIWIANYVLYEYGTGAVMGVPAHDERDFAFATKYELPIRWVIEGGDGDRSKPYVEPGTMINSGPFDGTPSEEGKAKVAAHLEGLDKGVRKVNYRLRDWLISRQRAWGAPIPIVYCDSCGTQPVPEAELPVRLPDDLAFTGEGSPLAHHEGFVNATCPKCGGPAKRETDTMDTFVCSSWYFLRFADPKNDQAPFDRALVDHWLPVDQYVGGIEHAVLHLLYSRFVTRALRDMGHLSFGEPFKALLTQGMVIKDGHKMSKSKGNVVSPGEMIEKYGADAVRLFIMFAAPADRDLEWSDAGIEGAFRFVNRFQRMATNSLARLGAGPWAAVDPNNLSEADRDLRRVVHQTVKKVTHDLHDKFAFNTAISSLMELTNAVYALGDQVSDAVLAEAMEKAILLSAPFMPHLAEELWHQYGYEGSVHLAPWPQYDEAATIADTIEIVVQINGKVRSRVEVAPGTPKADLEALARADSRIQELIGEKQVVKVIAVPDRLVNIVVK